MCIGKSKTSNNLVGVKRRVPIKIVSIYMIISFLWIYFSDEFTALISNDLLDYKTLQNIKGSIFIIITSVIIYTLIHSNINKILNLEKKLEDRETQNRIIVDSITNGIWELELKTGNTYFSPSYKNTLGYKDNEIHDTFDGWKRLVHPDDIGKAMENYKNCLENKNTKYEVEFRMKRKNGDYAWILSRGKVIYDENEIPTSMIGTHTDITRLKNAEKELRKLIEENKELLEETLEYDKLKTEFFSNISHELRTPLNIILSNNQLLSLYNRDDKKDIDRNRIDKSIKLVKQNCYRLLRLINNIIDISRIESNYLEMNRQNHDIVNVIKEITLSVAQYVESKGLMLEFITDIEKKIIAFDIDKVERIMLNLLSNAVKNTKSNDKIIVKIYNENQHIAISVKDTGIGIPKDKQKIIFERFRQTDASLTRKHEGSGIGLSLVKSLVQMHEGDILVNSEVDVGSEFIILLPDKKIDNEKIDLSKYNIIENTNLEKINIEFSDVYSG